VEPSGAVTLPRASRERSLYALVSPLRLANQRQGFPAHVLVLITDPEASGALPGETLSILCGLTNSEVEVANGLMAGLSLEQIAEAREVSRGTARVQLKSLLHKTGTRGQGELIRLLLSLPKTLPMES
jgi:DNA-binding CsgD family transcriptional regulator